MDDGWAEAAKLPPIDASVHLTGATVAGVTERLAAVAGVALPAVALSASQRTVAFVNAVRRSGRQLTVLADGLDEAQEPGLLAALLRELGTVTGVRVVVGTRASIGEGPDLPLPDGEELLDELGQRLEHVTVQRVRRDEDALAQYVVRRLSRAEDVRRAVGEEYGDAVQETAAMIAASDPATGDGREFLYASLAVHEILADPTLLASSRRGELAVLLRKDHRALFDVAIRRLARRLQSSRPVLEALAFAQGRGLPRAHRIWSTAASALARMAADETVDVPALTDDGLQAVLDVAGPYIMLDAEAGQSVYRLAHRTFQEHFLADEAQFGDVSVRAATIAAALLDIASRPESDLNPYLVRHLTGHLAAAGPTAWLALDERPAVLDRLDPHVVASDAMRTSGGPGQLPAGVIGTIASAHLIDAGTPADRPGLRALGTARATGYRPRPVGNGVGSHIGDAVEETGSAWEVRWARLRRHPPHLTLAGHVGPIRSVTAFPGPSGSCLVASGGDDRAVRIWNPETGGTAGSTIGGQRGKVTAVAAVVSPDGTVRLATASRGDRVRLWHPVTGRQATELRHDHAAVQTAVVAFIGRGGAARLATCDWNGTVRIWDPHNGQAAIRELTGHVGPAWAATCFTDAASGTLLATVGQDGTVRTWNPETGRPVRVWRGQDGPARAVAAVRSTDPADPSDLLATSGDDGIIVLRDPATGKPVRGPIRGHVGPVLALVGFTGQAGAGTAMLASGGEDGTVRVWDPVQERAVGPVLTGHTGPVRSLAVLRGVDGAAVLASGADDGTVRIWYPEIADASTVAVDQRDPVTAMAAVRGPAGSTVLATRAKDGAVTVWDQATGERRGPTIAGRPDPAPTLTAMTGSDGTALLATTGQDRTVIVWDPFSGMRYRNGPDHADRVWTVAGTDGTPLLATANGDGIVELWDVATGQRVGARLVGHTGHVLAVAAFAGTDGALAVAAGGEDGTIRVWELASGRQVGLTIRAHPGSVSSLAVLVGPGRRTLLASAGREVMVRIWDAWTGLPFRALGGHVDWVNAVVAVDGLDGTRLIASASDDQTVRVWQAATGQTLHVLPLGIRCLSLATAGQDLMVGTDEGLLVVRLHQGRFTGSPDRTDEQHASI